MPACPRCGRDNPPAAGFCNACGSPLVQPAGAGVRKTVTVLFCDLVDSTALGDRSDPEVLREVMARYHAELRTILERHGGSVEKFIGDAVMAVFGLPQAHEDDAFRAARAALEAREAVGAMGLLVRIGINTGEVVAGAGETFVTGDAVNVAARLEQTAQPGQVLIGGVTERLLRELVRTAPVDPLTLKGKAEPVAAHSLLDIGPAVSAVARRRDTPFIGRERELAQLERVFAAATEEQQPQLATVIGPPGIGKSRLVAELTGRVKGRVLMGHCPSYGQGITYWPLAEIIGEVGDVRAVLGQDAEAEFAAARIDAALGAAGASASSDEIAWAFRRLFEALAQRGPLMVVLDDIQWAEPTLLDLVEYVSSFARGAPLVLLCIARPDLLDARPGWGTPRPNATLVVVEPLGSMETEALVGALSGPDDDTKTEIIAAAAGNPLFVEQLIAHAADSGDGVLRIPPTIQALLVARIDSLAAGEREVIERASVEGQLFHRGSVRELMAESGRAGLASHLLSLVRKGFVRPDRSQFAGDDGFRFGHVLVRDTAYEAMPKRLRSELHERLADWLQSRLGDEAPPEIIGYHVDQACRFRNELLIDDGHSRQLALRAGHLLGQSARRAHARGDDAAVRALAERAIELLPEHDPDLPLLLVLLGSSLYEAGDVPRALEILARAQAAAAAIGQRGVELRGRADELAIRVRVDPAQETERALNETQRIIVELEQLDEVESLARAWRAVIEIGFVRCNFRLIGEASDRLLDCARQTGIRRDAIWAVRGLAAALAYGPAPVQQAIVEVEKGLAQFPQEGAGEDHLAELYAFAGRHEDAERAIESAKRRALDLGQRVEHAYASMAHGWIARLAATRGQVESELRSAARMFEEAGESSGLAGIAVILAELLYSQARFDEAEQWLGAAKSAMQPEDIWGQADLRALQAKLAARNGRPQEAMRLSAEAVDLARRTDGLPFFGDCLLSRAEVLHTLGQHEAARPVLEEALAVFERKGIVPSIERTRALLAEYSQSGRAGSASIRSTA